MATILAFKKRVQSLQPIEAARAALETTGDRLVEINREQMLEGKRRDGKDISPTYLEDPYFSSVEAAIGYSDWKDEITPNPKRKRGVPNLFIIGTFHRSITMDVVGDSLKFLATFDAADEIERKFALIYGLNAEKRTIYIDGWLRKEFVDTIKRSLKLR
jgi:hypothetical protein